MQLFVIFLMCSTLHLALCAPTKSSTMRSFAAEAKIHYNARNDTIPARLYFNYASGRIRIDFKTSTTAPFPRSQLVTQVLDISSGEMFELWNGKCSRRPISSQMLPLIALAVVPDLGRVTGALHIRSLDVGVWRARLCDIINDMSRSSNNYSPSKHLPFVVDTNAEVELLFLDSSRTVLQSRIIDPWGRRLTVELFGVKELDLDSVDQAIESAFPYGIRSSCRSEAGSCDLNCGNHGLCIGESCFCHHMFTGSSCMRQHSAFVPTGVCGNGILEEGEECDDGNSLDGDCCSSKCTIISDHRDLPCSNFAECRKPTGRCSAAGVCESEPAPDTTKCTSSDSCTDCKCINGVPKMIQKQLNCPLPPSVDDSCILSSPTCDALTGTCSMTVKPDGSRCSNTSCYGVCASGKCDHSKSYQCSSNDPCVASTCDPTSGACVDTPKPCESSLDAVSKRSVQTCEPRACFVFTGLVNDVCTYAPLSCPQSNSPCLSPTCVDNECKFTVNQFASCNDNNPCTSGDTCNSEGTCAGSPIECSSSYDSCQTGSCNPLNGQCESQTLPDGAPCSQFGKCKNGVCVLSTDNLCGNGVLDAGEQCDPQFRAGRDGVCCPNCTAVAAEIGDCSDQPRQQGWHVHCYATYCKRFETSVGQCIVDAASFKNFACGPATENRKCDGNGFCVAQ